MERRRVLSAKDRTVVTFLSKKKEVAVGPQKDGGSIINGPGTFTGIGDFPYKPNQPRRKGAGKRAWETRRARAEHLKWHDAGEKASTKVLASNFAPAKIKLLHSGQRRLLLAPVWSAVIKDPSSCNSIMPPQRVVSRLQFAQIAMM